MTPEEMRERSADKIDQIRKLAETLNVQMVPKQVVDTKTGFVELAIIFKDQEIYPKKEEPILPEGLSDKKNPDVEEII